MSASDFLSQVESSPAVSTLINSKRKQPLVQPDVRDTEYQERLTDSLRKNDSRNDIAEREVRPANRLQPKERPAVEQESHHAEQSPRSHPPTRPDNQDSASDTNTQQQPEPTANKATASVPQSRAEEQTPANDRLKPPAHIDEILPAENMPALDVGLTVQLEGEILNNLEPPAGLVAVINQGLKSLQGTNAPSNLSTTADENVTEAIEDVTVILNTSTQNLQSNIAADEEQILLNDNFNPDVQNIEPDQNQTEQQVTADEILSGQTQQTIKLESPVIDTQFEKSEGNESSSPTLQIATQQSAEQSEDNKQATEPVRQSDEVQQQQPSAETLPDVVSRPAPVTTGLQQSKLHTDRTGFAETVVASNPGHSGSNSIAGAAKLTQTSIQPITTDKPELTLEKNDKPEISKGPATAKSSANTVSKVGDTSSKTTLISTPSLTTGKLGSVKSSPEEIAQQAVQALQNAAQTGKPLRIRLDPPELGTLMVVITTEGGAVSARMEVQTASAQQALLEHLPLLKEALIQNGTQVDRIDVQLVEQSQEQQSTGDTEQQQQDDNEEQENDSNEEQAEDQPTNSEETPDENETEDKLHIAV